MADKKTSAKVAKVAARTLTSEKAPAAYKKPADVILYSRPRLNSRDRISRFRPCASSCSDSQRALSLVADSVAAVIPSSPAIRDKRTAPT